MMYLIGCLLAIIVVILVVRYFYEELTVGGLIASVVAIFLSWFTVILGVVGLGAMFIAYLEDSNALKKTLWSRK